MKHKLLTACCSAGLFAIGLAVAAPSASAATTTAPHQTTVAVTTTTTAPIESSTPLSWLPEFTITPEQAANPDYRAIPIAFYDRETGENAAGIDVQLELVILHEELHADGTIHPTGEERFVVAEWNTADTPCYLYETDSWAFAEYDYAYLLASFEKRAGHSWYYSYNHSLRDDMMVPCSNTPGLQEPAVFALTNDVLYDLTFPCTGTYSVDISFPDYYSGELIPGLECRLVDSNTNEVLDSWNTTDEPVKHFDDLKYQFEDWLCFDQQPYYCEVLNMPEDIQFVYGSAQDFQAIYFSRETMIRSLASGSSLLNMSFYMQTKEAAATSTAITTTILAVDPSVSTASQDLGSETQTTTTVPDVAEEASADSTTSAPPTAGEVTTATTTVQDVTGTGEAGQPADELPQTGYPFSTKQAAALACVMLMCGSAVTGFSLRKKEQ